MKIMHFDFATGSPFREYTPADVIDQRLRDYFYALNQQNLSSSSSFDSVKAEVQTSCLKRVDLTTLPDPSQFGRLGRYFERLVEAWVCHQPELEIIKTNLQVYAGGETLGEFDLLLRNTVSGESEHWEVAGKFYLYLRSGRSAGWLGPNPNDSLVEKQTKIEQKQLQLSESEAGRAVLSKLGISKPRTKMLFTGQLFRHPSDISDSNRDAPPNYSQFGWWLHADEFRDFAAETESLWIELPRLLWLSPCRLRDLTNIRPVSDFQEYLDARFKQYPSPALVVGGEIKAGYFEEATRGFVVSKEWRDRAFSRIKHASIFARREGRERN